MKPEVLHSCDPVGSPCGEPVPNVKNELVVRPGCLHDRPVLLKLAQQLGYSPSEKDVDLLLESDDGRAHRIFVATLEGEVVGWIEVVGSRTLTAGAEALICGLVVDEVHRGAGIGRRLVAEAERWAVERGLSAVRVRSRIEREGAHQFYRRLDYEEAKRQVVFRKSLDRS